jgi:hypothetical protein
VVAEEVVVVVQDLVELVVVVAVAVNKLVD